VGNKGGSLREDQFLRPYLSAAALLLAAAAPLSAQQRAPVVAAPVAASAEDARLTAFLDAAFADELRQRPQLATRLGSKEGQDRWDDNSDAAQLRRLEWRRASVARMKAAFDPARLSPDARANYDIWALELDRAETAYRYRRYTPPFYGYLYSAHAGLPNFLISTHTVSDAADMRAWIARVRAMPAVLDEGISQSRRSDADGIRAPRFQIERVIGGSRAIVTGAPFGPGVPSPLLADAEAKVAALRQGNKVTAAEGEKLLADARAALLSIRPAYDRVIAWAESDLAAAPSGRVGAVSLPGGRDWYAAALRLNTTTDLTAEQIHATGLSEVKRIEAEQDALARTAGLKDRQAYYEQRARLFPPRPWTDELRADYLKRANAAVANNRALLPRFFGELPQYRMEVIREPAFSEVAGGAAHAAGPSPDGTRPGRVWVHMLGVTEDPADVYDLMCHEAVPGHVMQGDIQARQTAAPKFRRGYGYVAFGEGWGLYSEALCKEMGAYPDTAADFLRLNAELFRAARLVVDTGIHSLGWTEDQAVDYMIRTGRAEPAQARAEVRRYITLPGQATGYKIGMIRIVELRARAGKALGSRFDLKGFHDLLIGSGSLPLSVLDQRVDAWIAARKA